MANHVLLNNISLLQHFRWSLEMFSLLTLFFSKKTITQGFLMQWLCLVLKKMKIFI
ncbi:MAG: hypothetical protein K0Q67_3525 [Cellvibrio sp.]|nr:hypothetical protein [Cellvibrio sp.]